MTPSNIVFGIRPLGRTRAPRIGKDIGLSTVQQAVALEHIVGVGCRSPHGVDHPRFIIHADADLHADVPLVTLLSVMHHRVELHAGVLGRTGRSNQRGIGPPASDKH